MSLRYYQWNGRELFFSLWPTCLRFHLPSFIFLISLYLILFFYIFTVFFLLYFFRLVSYNLYLYTHSFLVLSRSLLLLPCRLSSILVFNFFSFFFLFTYFSFVQSLHSLFPVHLFSFLCFTSTCLFYSTQCLFLRHSHLFHSFIHSLIQYLSFCLFYPLFDYIFFLSLSLSVLFISFLGSFNFAELVL